MCVACGAQAGYTEIEFTDMTAVWSEWVAKRTAGYAANRARHERVHNAACVANMQKFFDVVSGLFIAGNLGGAILTARMPLPLGNATAAATV